MRSLAGFKPQEIAALVVAYEPVWAIGTGKTATPEDAQEVCAAIRGRIRRRPASDAADGRRILYGGSVKAATSRASWLSAMSTAPWWVARASGGGVRWGLPLLRHAVALRTPLSASPPGRMPVPTALRAGSGWSQP